MWSFEASVEVMASRERLWSLFVDVGGWPAWNAGVERIDIDGPFAAGTTFVMHMPGGFALESTLAEVEPGFGFTDTTTVDQTVVRVSHRLREPGGGRTSLVYRLEAEGPNAEEVGRMASADFNEVLASLKNAAERRGR